MSYAKRIYVVEPGKEFRAAFGISIEYREHPRASSAGEFHPRALSSRELATAFGSALKLFRETLYSMSTHGVTAFITQLCGRARAGVAALPLQPLLSNELPVTFDGLELNVAAPTIKQSSPDDRKIRY